MSIAYTHVSPETGEATYDLTVITVCRNDLAGLRLTLRSVLNQKAKASLSIEHIIVDGNSDDGTQAWLQQQLEEKRIESFLSEADKGIYDAMNKGINMAHGRVLAFLNAADCYTQEDLFPCIAPILRGDTVHTTATAHIINPVTNTVTGTRRYNTYSVFVSTPCCHQSYFAEASAYRREGGYQAERLRCCADGMFMNSLIRQFGEPTIIDKVIVDYAAGGFSEGCGLTYAEEFIEMQWHFHPDALRRASQDALYARSVALQLLRRFRVLERKKKGSTSSDGAPIAHLRSMTTDVVAILSSGKIVKNVLLSLAGDKNDSSTSPAHTETWACRWRNDFCENYLRMQRPSYGIAFLRLVLQNGKAFLLHLLHSLRRRGIN